jgi:hypothetical protein
VAFPRPCSGSEYVPGILARGRRGNWESPPCPIGGGEPDWEIGSQPIACVCVLLQDLVQSCMSLFLSFSGNDEPDRHSIRRSRASEKRFCDSKGAGGVQGRQSCLIFDEFLDSVIIHRHRVESILQFTRVGGELVDNAATRGVQQKGNIFVACPRGGYTVSSLIVRFLSMCTYFHAKVGKPRLTR